MGTGWRKAFCNTIPRDKENAAAAGGMAAEKQQCPSPKLASPRLFCRTNKKKNGENVDQQSPKLECKTTPKSQARSPGPGGWFASMPSSPRSPFSILKNSLRLTRSGCGVCMQSLKIVHGMAIYTAECSHAFHFPCIASHVRKQSSLVCPVCKTIWKDVPLLGIHTQSQEEEKVIVVDSSTPAKKRCSSAPHFIKQLEVRCYADDEPLLTPKAGSKFVPIPEGEEEGVEEFHGFLVKPISSSHGGVMLDADSTNVVVSLSPEAAVISHGRTHTTYAVVLKIKAPSLLPARETERRAPIDLVAVLDVSERMTGAKLEMLKRAMHLVISSLSSADRLSVVAFSSSPKRMLPLTRMTPHGQRGARHIINRLACSHGNSMTEALKHATKVLEERRERNPVASIILLSGSQDDGVPASNDGSQRRRSSQVTSTRFSHVEIPVKPSGFRRDPAEDAFSKCVGGLLSVVVHDLKIQLGFAPGSDPGEITAVYPCTRTPAPFGSGCIRLGDLYAEEEKDLMVEIRVPASPVGSHLVLSVKHCYKYPVTQELIHGGERVLLVPQPQSARSGLPAIERLRNGFISTRAIAESRWLIEHGEVSSAMQLLSSARVLLAQSRSESAGEYMEKLEAAIGGGKEQWNLL